MADRSGIEWCDATWNPVIGCSVVSPGCKHCYAMRLAARLGAMGVTRYAGLTRPGKHGPAWGGEVRLAPRATLLQPLRWREPRRIFVNAMGDLFHEDVPSGWIDQVFAVMARCPQHVFLVLTKRAARMRATMTELANSFRSARALRFREADRALGLPVTRGDACWPPANLWLGVSAENQFWADLRISELSRTPAAVRFVSCEPLLGPIDLSRIDSPRHFKLDWVIAGGESGAGARPMHPAWPLALRDQCAAAGIPYFFKQWGEFRPVCPERDDPIGPTDLGRVLMGRVVTVRSLFEAESRLGFDVNCEPWLMERVGKRRAGHALAGGTHHDMPGRQGVTA